MSRQGILLVSNCSDGTKTATLSILHDWNGETTTDDKTIPYRDWSSYVVYGPSICLLGGWNAKDERCSDFDIVDIRSGVQRSGPSMQIARTSLSAVAIKDCILVFGGIGGSGNHLDSCEYYDKAHDRWRDLPKLLSPRSGSTALDVPDHGVILIGGDSPCDGVLDEVLLLRYSTLDGHTFDSNWNALPSTNVPRRYCSAAYHGEQVFVSGYSDLHRTYNAEKMNFPTNEKEKTQWTLLNIPESISDSSFFFVSFNAKLFLIKTRDGHVMEYRDPEITIQSEESVWKTVCRYSGTSPDYILINELD